MPIMLALFSTVTQCHGNYSQNYAGMHNLLEPNHNSFSFTITYPYMQCLFYKLCAQYNQARARVKLPYDHQVYWANN